MMRPAAGGCAQTKMPRSGLTARSLRSCLHQHKLRRQQLHCRAAAGSALTLHIGDTTVAFPFKQPQAQELSSSIAKLIQTFAAKQKAERPKRWEMMEYRFKGDTSQQELEYLELFCNPNQYATPFDAKVLVTLRTGDGVKVTTEGSLSAIKGDVDQYLETQA